MSRKNPEEQKPDPSSREGLHALDSASGTLSAAEELAEYLVISFLLMHTLKIFNPVGISDCYTTFIKEWHNSCATENSNMQIF